MRAWSGIRAAILMGPLLVAVLGQIGDAASNDVPTTRAGLHVEAITADALKPPECAALTLTAIVEGNGTFSGTNAGELILGSAGADSISAGSGSDCILAGGGGDIVSGQGDDDVLLGGPGADTLNGGFGADACYGGPDLDTFLSCESETQ